LCLYRTFAMLNLFLANSSFLPAIFVPLTGLVLPAVVFSFLFLYIEQDEIA
jgi:photosystem I subunit 8